MQAIDKYMADLLTTDEAVALLPIGKPELARLRKAGAIECVLRMGNRDRYRRADVDALIRSRVEAYREEQKAERS